MQRYGLLLLMWLSTSVSLSLDYTASAKSVRLQLDPDQRITQYVHRAWQDAEGLPQNSVYATAQTPDGYLWLATQEGLVRFDGRTFDLYNKSTVAALQNDEIRALLVDAAGALWIGTGSGLTRYQEGTFQAFTTADGLGSDFIRSLYQQQDGTLWVGTIEGGLARFNGEQFTAFGTSDGLAGQVILALEEDAGGTLWIGTERGLSTYANQQFSVVEEAEVQTLIWALEATSEGLWVGTNDGLALLEEDGVTVQRSMDGLCGDVVSALYQDAFHTLWVGTLDGGLCRLREGTFETFSEAEGLTSNRVRSLQEDREGNLWIGTDGGGVNQLRTGKLVPYTVKEGLSHNAAFAVLEDATGTLWVGTEGGGLNRADTAPTLSFRVQEGLPSQDVYALHEGADGSIWVGSYGGGVCKLTASRTECWSSADGLTSDNVYAVWEDQSGVVWVGTDDGLHQLDQGRVSLVEKSDELAHAIITSLFEDTQGRFWVGTYGAGLFQIDGDAVQTLGGEKVPSGVILTITEDEKGTVWFGTLGDGLCRVQDGRVGCLSERNGLPNDKVLQLLEDDSGRLWMATMRGIFHIDKADAEDVLDGHASHVAATIFSRADGLRTQEANGGTQPAAWKATNGDLWFATMEGLVRVKPEQIPTNQIAPAVHIQQVLVDGRAYKPGATHLFQPGSQEFEIQYTGITFAAPEQVTFEYRLHGYQDAWEPVRGRRVAYFTNLEPKAYRFEVRARNRDGVWSAQAASIGFEVLPFFYQTTWFLVLCIGGALALGALLYEGRVRQLRMRERELTRRVDEQTKELVQSKEETEQALFETEQARQVIAAQADKLREMDRVKTRFFNNISHEFRTPLTLIIGPLENALSGVYGPLNTQVRGQVEMILRNARRLLRLINQLLDLAKAEAGQLALQARPGNIVAFLEGIVFSFATFADERGIELAFKTEIDVQWVDFDREKMEKVFFNLLSNALKFTPEGGHVHVVLVQENPKEIIVHVEDSGPGIPEEAQVHIFDRFQQVEGTTSTVQQGTGIGLALCRELVGLHEGTLLVSSTVGKGSTFTVTLPCEQVQAAPAEDTPEVKVEHEWLSDVIGSHDNESARSSEMQNEAEGDDIARKTILVVDDNPDIRTYIRGILETMYRVHEAGDGEEGWEQIQTSKPDLILSDVMMPRLDGYGLCERVKTDAETKHIPLILLTAKASIDQRVEGLERGADDYISKPFNARELAARIHNILVIHEQEAELKELNENLEERVASQLNIILAERVRYENELITARDKAEAAAQFKSTMLDNVSHEMRTPIAGILGFAEILNEEVEGELREFVGLIRQSGERLLRTISAILDLSKIEDGTWQLKPSLIHVGAATRSTVSTLEVLATQKGLAFHVETPEPDMAVFWDATAYDRILTNLIGNAIKFTESGEIRVEVAAREEEVHVRIKDTGIGISTSFFPELFEAFKQESEGLTRDFEGSGIGLTITKELVESMKGTIRVESEKGEGSTFTVSLPRGLPNETPSRRKSRTSALGAADGFVSSF